MLARDNEGMLEEALTAVICSITAADTRRKRAGLTTAERTRLKELEREARELRRANEILRKASAYFAQAELDRPPR
jgi:transposase-like protein